MATIARPSKHQIIRAIAIAAIVACDNSIAQTVTQTNLSQNSPDQFLALCINQSEQEAIRLPACDNAISVNPSNKQALFIRANLLAKKGESLKAIQDYLVIEKLIDPNNLKEVIDHAYGVGLAYGRNKDYEKSISSFSRAISLNPDFGLAYFNRGMSYRFYNQHENAVRDFDEAEKRGIKTESLLVNRAIAYEAIFKYKKNETVFDALLDYKNALKLNPNSQFAKAATERLEKWIAENHYENRYTEYVKMRSLQKDQPSNFSNEQIVMLKSKMGTQCGKLCSFDFYSEETTIQDIISVIEKENLNPNIVFQPNSANGIGRTGLETAVTREIKPSIIDFLLKLGADVNRFDDQGLSVLHQVANNDRLQGPRYIEMLKAAGADIEAQSKLKFGRDWNYVGQGSTPLHFAASHNWGERSVEIIKALLKEGANLSARNADGKTPYNLAESKKNKDILALVADTKQKATVASMLSADCARAGGIKAREVAFKDCADQGIRRWGKPINDMIFNMCGSQAMGLAQNALAIKRAGKDLGFQIQTINQFNLAPNMKSFVQTFIVDMYADEDSAVDRIITNDLTYECAAKLSR